MDPFAQLPIVVEHHDIPTPLGGERVRRRGYGYGQATVALPPPTPGTNRADRRRAARATAVRAGRLAPLAAAFLAPVALLAAGPAAVAATTTDASTTTTTAAPPAPPSTPTSTTTSAPPTTPETPATRAPNVTTATTGAPTTGGPTTPDAPATTAPRTQTPSTTGAPATAAPGTAPRASSTTKATAAPTTAAPTTTSSSSTTVVPGAVRAPAVGEAVLPPAAPADADPIALTASEALTAHHDLTVATRALADLTAERTAADVEAGRLETRVAELTARAFDLARTGLATAETESARAAAQVDLDHARATSASLALKHAAATTALADLSARYPTARLLLATLVARQAGADPVKLDAAWAAASDARVDVVYAALAQVGDPYVWAAVGPDTFDCSGLTAYAWRAAGVELPHYTVLQRQATLETSEDRLAPGDLVFNLDGPNGGHVQLALGLGRLVVHAPSPGHTVTVTEYRTVTGFGSPLDDVRPPTVAAPPTTAPAAHG